MIIFEENVEKNLSRHSSGSSDCKRNYTKSRMQKEDEVAFLNALRKKYEGVTEKN